MAQHVNGPDTLYVIDMLSHLLGQKHQFFVGGCIGLDELVATCLHDYGENVHAIIPADRSQVDPKWRERCTTFEEMPEGTDYRDRNTALIKHSDRLIAFARVPLKVLKGQRSGTLMTINIALRAGKPVEIYCLSTRSEEQL